MIDLEKKRARDRRGSSEYRKRSRARGIPPNHQIDRALATVLLADILRPVGSSVDEWRKAELERAVAKQFGVMQATAEQQRDAREAIRRRVRFLLNAKVTNFAFDNFEPIGPALHDE